MPEGPSIVLLKEAVPQFEGKKVVEVAGNAKIDMDRMVNRKIISFNTWGKHFLISFKGFYVRVHFLLFGSYTMNERKDRPVRLRLLFSKGELNFYACAVKIMEGLVQDDYDFSADVMSDEWDEAAAKKKLLAMPDKMICDALLEQELFSGVGNIIKNEVLYRVKVHPETRVKHIPATKIKKITAEARIYSFQFLEWKRNFVLKQHWLAHTKKTCSRCNLPLIKKITGVKKRRSFFCKKCQELYK
jgi:endonuclease VIII